MILPRLPYGMTAIPSCYTTGLRKSDEIIYIPNEVVKAHAIDGKSMLRAWREFKGFTQKETAHRMGIVQSAYAQIEQSDSPRESTIRKAALALLLNWRLLTLNDEEG